MTCIWSRRRSLRGPCYLRPYQRQDYSNLCRMLKRCERFKLIMLLLLILKGRCKLPCRELQRPLAAGFSVSANEK